MMAIRLPPSNNTTNNSQMSPPPPGQQLPPSMRPSTFSVGSGRTRGWQAMPPAVLPPSGPPPNIPTAIVPPGVPPHNRPLGGNSGNNNTYRAGDCSSSYPSTGGGRPPSSHSPVGNSGHSWGTVACPPLAPVAPAQQMPPGGGGGRENTYPSRSMVGREPPLAIQEGYTRPGGSGRIISGSGGHQWGGSVGHLHDANNESKGGGTGGIFGGLRSDSSGRRQEFDIGTWENPHSGGGGEGDGSVGSRSGHSGGMPVSTWSTNDGTSSWGDTGVGAVGGGGGGTVGAGGWGEQLHTRPSDNNWSAGVPPIASVSKSCQQQWGDNNSSSGGVITPTTVDNSSSSGRWSAIQTPTSHKSWGEPNSSGGDPITCSEANWSTGSNSGVTQQDSSPTAEIGHWGSSANNTSTGVSDKDWLANDSTTTATDFGWGSKDSVAATTNADQLGGNWADLVPSPRSDLEDSANQAARRNVVW